MSEQPPNMPPDEENPIVEFTIVELEKVLETATEPYYCVDPIREPRSKRKLIDPCSELTSSIVKTMYEGWGVDKNKLVRVTKHLEAIEDFLDPTKKTVNQYVNQIHRLMVKIFGTEKSTYSGEVQGLATVAVEMLDNIFGYDKVGSFSVGPSDLRTVNTYYDHLVNTSVLWLAAFAHLNRKRSEEAGAMEVWRSKNKEEVRKITDPRGRKPAPPLYYDYYGRDRCPSDLEPMKKGDMGLVVSGFFGALMHDVVFLKEPKILISIKGHIDDVLKQHVDGSNSLLKQKLAILHEERPLLRNIIKNHHEYIDGSGYPGGKTEKDLHLFVQIVSMCDMYDEYCTQFMRGKIIRLMSQGAGRIFAGDILRSFFAILRPYDIGERLDVYEGKGREPVFRAEILDSQQHFRPKIRIVETLQGGGSLKSGDELDLSLEENVVYFL
ncbi:MAG: HD domain-containing phosphohydrolase [bacterium]